MTNPIIMIILGILLMCLVIYLIFNTPDSQDIETIDMLCLSISTIAGLLVGTGSFILLTQ